MTGATHEHERAYQGALLCRDCLAAETFPENGRDIFTSGRIGHPRCLRKCGSPCAAWRRSLVLLAELLHGGVVRFRRLFPLCAAVRRTLVTAKSPCDGVVALVQRQKIILTHVQCSPHAVPALLSNYLEAATLKAFDQFSQHRHYIILINQLYEENTISVATIWYRFKGGKGRVGHGWRLSVESTTTSSPRGLV